MFKGRLFARYLFSLDSIPGSAKRMVGGPPSPSLSAAKLCGNRLRKPLTRGVLLPKAAKKKRSSLLPLEYLEGRDSAPDWLRSEASRSSCARFKAVSGDAAVVEEVLPETLKVRIQGSRAGDGKAGQGR